jgi:low temperature requirement protein LtrA
MAASTDAAVADGGRWFGASYVAVRLLGLGLYLRVSRLEERVAVMRFATASLLGLGVVAVGAVMEPPQRIWWWSAAIVLDLVAGYIGGKAQGWDVRVKHFVERHALIVIIALGESLIVAAGSVSGGDRSGSLIMAGALALLLTCLLWWTYFSWVREHLEHHLANVSGTARTQVGRDAFSFLHFPLVCGIIGIAVAFEKILGHADDPVTLPVAAALGGGALLYLGATAAAVWRVSGRVLLPRIAVAMATAGALVFTVGRAPCLALAGVVVGALLVVGFEWRLSETARG